MPDGSHCWSLQVSPEVIKKYLSIESSNPLLRALLKLPGDSNLHSYGRQRGASLASGHCINAETSTCTERLFCC